MRLFLFALVIAGVVVFAAKSRGDVTVDNTQAPAPTPTGTQTHHEPFTSYDPGPGSWSYDKLQPDEQAQVDHVKSTANWPQVAGGYAATIQANAQSAAASSADHQLGTSDSSSIGVVP